VRDVELNPFKIVPAFSRCANYPRDDDSLKALAQGLQRAASTYHVSMCDIVERCLESSDRCPTDYNLMEAARALKPPDSPDLERTLKCPHGLCDGSGWRERYMLHTHHAGNGDTPAYVEKEPITFQQYEDLSRHLDWLTQKVYAGRFRCKCHPARDLEAEPKPRRRGMKQVAATDAA
jgi:hypothetical protein